MKTTSYCIGLVTLALAVTLAVAIGSRLGDQALAVLAGAVCGAAAAIPTSLLVVAVSRRRAEERTRVSVIQETYPPVVVIASEEGMPCTSNADDCTKYLRAQYDAH